ncbi:MAG TPA: hypothetical protein VF155_08875 [Candidatus Dormibacteraeota bacterium]
MNPPGAWSMVRSRVQRLRSTAAPRSAPSAAIALACATYLLGVRWVFVLVLIAVSGLVLPVPRVMRSVAGRLTIGCLYAAALLQLAVSIEFLIAPASGFRTAAVITTALGVGLVLVLPPSTRRSLQTSVFTWSDAGAVAVAVLFIAPFAFAMAVHDPLQQIVTWGGRQIVDGPNVFFYVAEQIRNQHFPYGAAGSVYTVPLGFYTMVAFVENAFNQAHASMGWPGALSLYIGEYLLIGSLLGYACAKLCQTWVLGLNARPLTAQQGRTLPVVSSLAVGVPLVLFLLMVLVMQGFLAYAYVVATIIVAVICLHEFSEFSHTASSKSDDGDDERPRLVYWLAAAVLLFGTACTWPLLVPPLAVTLLLSLLSRGSQVRRLARWLVQPVGVAMVVGFALLLLPVYFQFRYGNLSTQVNVQGGIAPFPYLAVIATVAIALLVSSFASAAPRLRSLTLIVVIPLVILVGALALEQKLVLGSVAYYAAKTALLLDAFGLVFGTALLIASWLRRKGARAQLLLLVPVPTAVALLLLLPSGGPLTEARTLFTDDSSGPAATTFARDVQLYTRLGSAGHLKHFDAVSLHFRTDQRVFTANMELPYWAGMMQYDASDYDRAANSCFQHIYYGSQSGTTNHGEQVALLNDVRQCARLAAEHGNLYYVVTDRRSAPEVAQALGGLVTVVD